MKNKQGFEIHKDTVTSAEPTYIDKKLKENPPKKLDLPSYDYGVECGWNNCAEAVKQQKTDLIEKIEKIIEEERYSGAPIALNKLIKIIKEG